MLRANWIILLALAAAGCSGPRPETDISTLVADAVDISGGGGLVAVMTSMTSVLS